MPFYMFQGKYSQGSFKAFIANPRDREADLRKMMEGMGVKLHHLFFAFGEIDVVALFEADNDTDAAAMMLSVAAAGGVSGGGTTKLMTSGEAMAAMRKAHDQNAKYKAPA